MAFWSYVLSYKCAHQFRYLQKDYRHSSMHGANFIKTQFRNAYRCNNRVFKFSEW